MTPWLMARDKATIFTETQAQRIPTGPVNTMKDVVEDAHLHSRQYFVTVEPNDMRPIDLSWGSLPFQPNPMVHPRPAPHLGEHNDEIYGGRLGVSREELLLLWQMGII